MEMDLEAGELAKAIQWVRFSECPTSGPRKAQEHGVYRGRATLEGAVMEQSVYLPVSLILGEFQSVNSSPAPASKRFWS